MRTGGHPTVSCLTSVKCEEWTMVSITTVNKVAKKQVFTQMCSSRYFRKWKLSLCPDITVMVDWALKINYLSTKYQQYLHCIRYRQYMLCILCIPSITIIKCDNINLSIAIIIMYCIHCSITICVLRPWSSLYHSM